jgi:hypothetical protein
VNRPDRKTDPNWHWHSPQGTTDMPSGPADPDSYPGDTTHKLDYLTDWYTNQQDTLDRRTDPPTE